MKDSMTHRPQEQNLKEAALRHCLLMFGHRIQVLFPRWLVDTGVLKRH